MYTVLILWALCVIGTIAFFIKLVGKPVNVAEWGFALVLGILFPVPWIYYFYNLKKGE